MASPLDGRLSHWFPMPAVILYSEIAVGCFGQLLSSTLVCSLLMASDEKYFDKDNDISNEKRFDEKSHNLNQFG